MMATNMENPVITRSIDLKKIEDAARQILVGIGEDPEREGLLKTPQRVAKSYAELMDGYSEIPEKLINCALFGVDYDQMVVVNDIASGETSTSWRYRCSLSLSASSASFWSVMSRITPRILVACFRRSRSMVTTPSR